MGFFVYKKRYISVFLNMAIMDIVLVLVTVFFGIYLQEERLICLLFCIIVFGVVNILALPILKLCGSRVFFRDCTI